MFTIIGSKIYLKKVLHGYLATVLLFNSDLQLKLSHELMFHALAHMLMLVLSN